MRSLLERYPGEVAVVYRHLPLKKHAREAALGAICAERVKKFDSFYDLVFAQADSIGVRTWVRFAADAGIADTLGFQRCMKDSLASAILARDEAAAATLGITGTPTFLINDLLVMGDPGLDIFNRYVRDALKATRR
jgi:protein-disulfide isomerase